MEYDWDVILSEGESYTVEFKENPDKELPAEVCALLMPQVVVYMKGEYATMKLSVMICRLASSSMRRHISDI